VYDDGEKEFYDHLADPDEFHNLAGNPNHEAIVNQLCDWLPEKAEPEFKAKSERIRIPKK
jgi:hypothetical protein